MSTLSGPLPRAAILARLFALLGLCVPLFLNPTSGGVAGVLTLAVVWSTASLIDPVPHSVVRTVTDATPSAASARSPSTCSPRSWARW